jgi:CRISPR system Cascade subunit CasC
MFKRRYAAERLLLTTYFDQQRRLTPMILEFHILQNFAPSNLNRDDTGSPKDCEFGGHRRARISSQCFKRAIRTEPSFYKFLLQNNGGVRTRRLILEIAERLTEERPVSEKIVKLVSEVFAEGGIERPKSRKGEDAEKDQTKLLLFMERKALDEMAALFKANWDELTRGNKETRGNLVSSLGAELATRVKAPDIALFGRMVEIEGAKPFGKLNLGIDAACQVAHAISTNKVSMEFDFYTAVDELIPIGETGAGMLGTVEFNSACFYRYANVDVKQLIKNLAGDGELASKTIQAFIHAAVTAIPTGKQNSMAAQNPPSFVLAVARDAGLWSLANAFVKPVRPNHEGDLIENSIKALDGYWGDLVGMYGKDQIKGVWAASLAQNGLVNLKNEKVTNLKELIGGVMSRLDERSREAQ